MKYRNLGNSGLKVSEISLGSYLTYGDGVAEAEAIKCIRAAYDLGVNFFDTADSYAGGAAERILGKAFQGLSRDSLVVSTKCFMPRNDSINAKGLSRKNIRASVHQSLKNLNLDYIDVLLCHRFDEDVPLEETISALNDLIVRGDILYWGVSRWTNEQMQSAIEISTTQHKYKPIENQYFYNMLNRTAESIFSTSKNLGLGVVAYAPLAQGVLTGKYLRHIPEGSRASDPKLKQSMWHLQENDLAKCAKLVELATSYGISIVELALAWILRHDVISSVLIGATKIGQIEDNIKAVNLVLSDEIIQKIELILA